MLGVCTMIVSIFLQNNFNHIRSRVIRNLAFKLKCFRLMLSIKYLFCIKSNVLALNPTSGGRLPKQSTISSSLILFLRDNSAKKRLKILGEMRFTRILDDMVSESFRRLSKNAIHAT